VAVNEGTQGTFTHTMVLRAVCVNAGGIMSTQPNFSVQCDDQTSEQKYMNINGGKKSPKPTMTLRLGGRKEVMRRERYVTLAFGHECHEIKGTREGSHVVIEF